MFACIALGALLLTGCKREETLIDDSVPVEKGKLSFVLPMGGNQSVTYASSLPGEKEEFEIQHLYIFWFQDDGGGNFKFFQKFECDGSSAGDIVMTPNGASLSPGAPSTIATIDVGDDQTASRFYIVANVNGVSTIKSNFMAHLTQGTLASVFETQLAEALLDANGDYTTFRSPLPMSVKNDAAYNTPGGFVYVPNPSAQKIVSGVHLTRRVARFDIMNHSQYSNFAVKNIILNRIPTQGELHDRGSKPSLAGDSWLQSMTARTIISGAAGGALSNGIFNGTPIASPTDLLDDAGNPNPDDIFDEFQDGSNDSLQIAKAAFYLFPTVLRQNDSSDPSDGTEILVEGTYGGVTRLYKLNLTADKEIEANKLYRIRIHRSINSNMNIELTVDEWDEDKDSIPTIKVADSVVWPVSATITGSKLSWTPATVNLKALGTTPADLEYSSASGDSVEFVFVTEGTNLKDNQCVQVVLEPVGTAGVDYLASDWALMDGANRANVVTYNTVKTYGTHYTTTHTIKLPPTDEPMEVTMKLINPANSKELRTVNLKSNNYDMKGKPIAMVGDTIMDATRWQKAIVTKVDSSGHATGKGYGSLTEVVALIGQCSSSNFTNFSGYNSNSPSAQINYLNTNCGGSNFVYVSSDTFVTGVASGAQVVPAGLISFVRSKFGILASSSPGTLKAIIVNLNKANAPELPVLTATGSVNIRTNASAIAGDYPQSQVLALINY